MRVKTHRTRSTLSNRKAHGKNKETNKGVIQEQDGLSPKSKALIKRAVRKAFLSSDVRSQCKGNSKIDKMLYCCASCDCYMYEGVSIQNYSAFVNKYGVDRVIMEKGEVDHIIPVANNKVDFSWDLYVKGVFCDISNLQYLCKSCHKIKSKSQTSITR